MKKNIKNLLKFISFTTLLLFINSCSSLKDITLIGLEITELQGSIDSDTSKRLKETTISVSKATEKITPENEYYLGRTTAAIILQEYKLYKNEDVSKYVNKICKTITINSEKPYIFNDYYVGILDTEEIMAYSTPGGHILLTRGLLKCASTEDELASVIAHEIAHIQKQHSLQAIKSSRITNATLDLANLTMYELKDDEEKKEYIDFFGSTANEIVSTLVETGFSKEQEFEADTYALLLMHDAGYNPQALIPMLEKVNQDSSINKLLKTHPSSKKRIKNVEKQLAKYTDDYSEKSRLSRYNDFSHLF